VTRWGPERRLGTNVRGRHGYTYPNPIWLSEEPRPLFLFWRGGSFEPSFSTSRNGGSWSRARRLIDGAGDRPYFVLDSNGRDTIRIAFSDGHPDERRTSVYYAAYRDGRFARADGRSLGARGQLPLEPAAADTVYSAKRSGTSAWVYDVGVGHDGRPVVLYATFPSAADHRYHYARWNGAAWVSRQITAAGPTIEKVRDNYYIGGLVLDSRDASVVYLSRQVAGVYQLERWATPDGGVTWSTTRITSGSAGSYRPASVLGPSFGEDHDLFWMSGRYTGWSDYGTSIRTRVPDGAGDPPDSAFRATRSRGLAVRLRARPARSMRVRRRWAFGDGAHAAGPRRRDVTHTYAHRGVYRVVLTVTGRGGRRDVFVREVAVRR
jgi:hypothetical protein